MLSVSSISSCAGSRPRLLEDARHAAHQAFLAELARRQVDRDRRRGRGPASMPARAPGGRPRAAPTRRCGTIRPVSSASGMKRAGRTRPHSGCIQRTSASAPTMRAGRAGRPSAGSAAGTRLRSSARRRRVLQRQALVHALVHLRGVELEVVAAVLLGAVHRRVGVLQQRVDVGPVLRVEADAGAAGDVAAPCPRWSIGSLDLGDDALHRAEDDLLVRLVVQDQHELVAAEARHGVALAQHARAGARPCAFSSSSPVVWPSCR